MTHPNEPETAVMRWAKKFYDLMLDRSEALDDTEERIYKGQITTLFDELGASKTYYSKVRKLLLESDCIQILQRGSRDIPTIAILKRPPSSDALADALENLDLTNPLAPAKLAGYIGALAESVGALEAWRESLGGINLKEYIIETERRIKKLESEISKLKRT